MRFFDFFVLSIVTQFTFFSPDPTLINARPFDENNEAQIRTEKNNEFNPSRVEIFIGRTT